MTQEHPSKLSFSIEESVWLNKGQEVEEILGMSLEPEIVIEERDHHVYIKGGLRLIGEYQLARQDEVIDVDSDSLEEQVSFRSAGDVTVSEDGSGSIKHFFPIDVTIPISRIQNLDDVYVQVESFDYDLPEKSCIQLTADISISGMTNQEIDEERVTEEDEGSTGETVPTSFAFEARRQPAVEDAPVVSEPASAIRQEPVLPYMAQPIRNQYGYGQQQETDYRNTDYEEAAPQQSLRYAQDDQIEEVVEDRHVAEAEETKINLAPLKEIAKEPVLEEQPEEEVEEEKQPPTYREENALYLTKMMSKGEERFTKWKMCIIQENESLDTIASRYDVTTNQLVRMNRLQKEQVEEGQILYIPVTVES